VAEPGGGVLLDHHRQARRRGSFPTVADLIAAIERFIAAWNDRCRGRRGGRRKGFTETDYAALFDAAHRQLGGPIVLVWDDLNTHVSAAMAEIIAARPWLTVFRLPPYAHELNPWSRCGRS
jgi:hypothetical protein